MLGAMRVSSAIGTPERHRLQTERAVRLAELQFGRIARRQLLAIGLSKGRIATWLRQGRLRRLLPGVYALGHAAGGEEARLSAALLYAGAGSALSRDTALWWRGLLEAHRPPIHIDAPGSHRSRRLITVHHPARIEAEPVRGLPVVLTPTAITASASELGFRTLRKVLSRAEFRGELDLGKLSSSLGKGVEGSVALRRAIVAHMPQLAHTENEFEDDFLFLIERFALPLPEVNVRVGRFRPDALWRDRRLIVELDGRDAHTKPAQVARDHDRDLKLRAMGYTVVRYTWAQVNFQAASVAADLRRLLGLD